MKLHSRLAGWSLTRAAVTAFSLKAVWRQNSFLWGTSVFT